MKNLNYKYIFCELIPHGIHSIAASRNRILLLFTLEGILFTLVNNLIGSNNNLFATRLGAGNFELSLVIMLPQLVGMIVLIPGGILTDRMRNKRNMVSAALAALTILYVLIGFVPALGAYRLGAFLTLLAISTGPLTIYNVSWQAYFSDVVHIDSRNNILTVRTGISFLIGISIPLISGAMLASAAATPDKIRLHQVFYWIAGALLLIQIFILSRIKSDVKQHRAGINIKMLKSAFIELAHNRKFLSFVSVAIFFYLFWHIDWTLYFIGQVNYLGMNEAWLSYISIGNAMIQFLTIGIWSRINAKRGVRYAIIFGSLGLAFCPVAMIVSTGIPGVGGRITFLILNTLANTSLATTSLNILQCLLQVLPEDNKTLNISIYTVLVSLSNAVMPLIGVSAYTALGADLKALHTIFWIIFLLRIVSTGLWTLRWWKLRIEPK